MPPKGKKKRKNSTRSKRSSKSNRDSTSSKAIQTSFAASNKTSIFAQENRAGSTRTQGRGKAEANLKLTQLRAYTNDMAHSMSELMRQEIEYKAAELQRLIDLRNAMLKDTKVQVDMQTDLHDRLLSKAEQKTATQAHKDWIASEQLKRKALLSAGTLAVVAMLPSLTTDRRRPIHLMKELERGEFGFTATRPVQRDHTTREARTRGRSFRKINQNTRSLEDIKVAMDVVDQETDKNIKIMNDPVPINIIHYVIESISEHTTKGSNKRGKEVKWAVRWMKHNRWNSPSTTTLRKFIRNYEKDKSLPKAKGTSNSATAEVMALVLQDIQEAREKLYAPNTDNVRDFLAIRRAELANSQGKAAQAPSKSTLNRQMKRITANTQSTRKSDNMTSSEKRYLAKCWRNAFGNYYLRQLMIEGPRLGYARQACAANPIKPCNYWNHDAFGLIIRQGHDVSERVFVTYEGRNTKISGATHKGSQLPLRLKPHCHCSAYGQYSMTYLCPMKSGFKVYKGKDMWLLTLPTTNPNRPCKCLCYDATATDIGYKTCLWLIDHVFIPDILAARHDVQGLKEENEATALHHASVEMCDGEVDMMKAIQTRIDDGTFKKFKIDVGKPCSKTTGLANTGQECDLNTAGFKTMKLKVRVGVDKWYQENQAKRLALDNEDVGVSGIPVAVEGNKFDLVEDSPFWKAFVKQICGGQNASAGFTMTKWRLLGQLLYVATYSEPAAFASNHITDAFVASSAYPLDRMRAISTNDSFCRDLTEAQRRYLLSDEFDELCKLEMMKSNHLSDAWWNSLHIHPGRQLKDRTEASISLRSATKVTGEPYQEHKAIQVKTKLDKVAAKELRKKKRIKEKLLKAKKKKQKQEAKKTRRKEKKGNGEEK